MKLTLQEVKSIMKDNDAEIRKFGVKEIYLFGSVVRGEAKETSDVDFFVVFNNPSQVCLFTLVDLQQFLETKLNKTVDIGTRNSLHRMLKTQILQEAIRVA